MLYIVGCSRWSFDSVGYAKILPPPIPQYLLSSSFFFFTVFFPSTSHLPFSLSLLLFSFLFASSLSLSFFLPLSLFCFVSLRVRRSYYLGFQSLWMHPLQFCGVGGSQPPVGASTASLPYSFFCRFTTAVISELCPGIFNWQSVQLLNSIYPSVPHLLSDPSPFSPTGTSPSLASLLATPLANLGPSRTAPLVLSSALPPIPGKVVEVVRLGSYVDFRDLLPDNVAFKQRVVDTGILGPSPNPSLHIREVSDIETWLHCFLAFVAAKVNCKSNQRPHGIRIDHFDAGEETWGHGVDVV